MKNEEFEKSSVKNIFKTGVKDINNLDKSKKTIVFIIFFILVFDLIACLFIFFDRHNTPVKLECIGTEEISALRALDKAAHKSVISENQFADFKFSENQRNLFKSVYDKYDSVALTIRIKVYPTKSQLKKFNQVAELPVKFGFLTDEDFTAKGKFIKSLYPQGNKLVVQGNLKKAPQVMDVCIAVKKSDDILKEIPRGFFVYSTERIRVLGACIVPAQIGFDISTTIPFYGFAYSGGKINFDNTSFDYSGAAMVFPVGNTRTNVMPEYVIKFFGDKEVESTKEKSVNVELNAGGEKLSVKNSPNGKQIIIPAAALKKSFDRIDLGNNSNAVAAILIQGVKKQQDKILGIKTDPGLILKYKPSMWRNHDYEVFEWDRFPGILFFDTRNYDVQSKFFTRLAYFVEKEGFKGTLLTNEQLEGKHGYNAHDYSADSMAKFFNIATQQRFKLNDEELLLKKILIDNGLFEVEGDFVRAKEGGLVSISQESTEWLRATLLAHEGWHTLYFRDSEFRNFVAAVFHTIDPYSLQFILDYFASQPQLGYDQSDDYLIKNEFMAYIMQQSLNQVASYFIHCAERGTVIKFTPDLAAYIRENKALGIEDAAIAMNDYVFDKYGIVCGNISLVNR